jgi:hypothetical protein
VKGKIWSRIPFIMAKVEPQIITIPNK